MDTHLTKVTIATAISLLGLGVNSSQVKAATLFVGRYGSFVKDINQVGFIPSSKVILEVNNIQNNNSVALNRSNRKTENLINKIDALGSSEVLKKQIEQGYDSFTEKINNDENNSNVETLTQNSDLTTIDSHLAGIANPDDINQNIQDRYYGLVENDEQISLFESNQLSKELLKEELKAIEGASGAGTQNQQYLNTDAAIQNALNEQNARNKSNSNNIYSQDNESKSLFPKSLNPGILIAVIGGGCIALVPIVNAMKNSKKALPNEVITLHKKTLNKVTSLARKIERIDDDKFTNQEFILYTQLRHKIEQGFRRREPICLSIKYLEVGLIAQSSFLQLEQIELKYRSRKQQDFYDFVADSITDDIDKKVFCDRVKRKLAEVIPLVHTEEGRAALQAYLKEVEKISQYDLGLKLLSLFKKYQLADFSILRKIAQLVEQSTAHSLLTDDGLNVVVLENYEVFKKVAPIIEIKEEDIQTKFFTKVLQYLGLARRHEKSYQEFQDLIKLLMKWQAPADSLKVIRQQYFNGEYQLPKEFYGETPGSNIYKKYEEYLNKKKSSH